MVRRPTRRRSCASAARPSARARPTGVSWRRSTRAHQSLERNQADRDEPPEPRGHPRQLPDQVREAQQEIGRGSRCTSGVRRAQGARLGGVGQVRVRPGSGSGRVRVGVDPGPNHNSTQDAVRDGKLALQQHRSAGAGATGARPAAQAQPAAGGAHRADGGRPSAAARGERERSSGACRRRRASCELEQVQAS